MADDRLAIGAFSRASSISVRTLRNYHESGLLVPASVDPATGYRSYTVDQLADALIIVRLRDLDVPLADVHRILEARDPELTRAVLAQHRATMQARLAETERIVATLQRGLPSASTPVHLVDTPPQHVLTIAATVASEGLWPWLERTAATLVALADRYGERTGSPGALYTGELVDEAEERVTVIVPITAPFLVPAAAGVSIGEIPGTTWAVLVHTDGFASVGETYRMLGAWVGRNATPLADREIKEQYPGLAGRAPGDSAIELCWPLAAAGTGGAPRTGR